MTACSHQSMTCYQSVMSDNTNDKSWLEMMQELEEEEEEKERTRCYDGKRSRSCPEEWKKKKKRVKKRMKMPTPVPASPLRQPCRSGLPSPLLQTFQSLKETENVPASPHRLNHEELKDDELLSSDAEEERRWEFPPRAQSPPSSSPTEELLKTALLNVTAGLLRAFSEHF